MSEAEALSLHANVPVELARLVTAEAAGMGYGLRNVRRDDRFAPLVNARQHIAMLARSQGYSFPQIGRALNRDHSTIISLVRRRAA